MGIIQNKYSNALTISAETVIGGTFMKKKIKRILSALLVLAIIAVTPIGDFVGIGVYGWSGASAMAWATPAE